MNPPEGDLVSGDAGPRVPWHSLSKEDHQRLGLVIGVLHEFHEGYYLLGELQAWLRELEVHRNVSSPRYRFVWTSLLCYAHDLYVANPKNAVLPLLRSIGRPKLADSFESLLNTGNSQCTLRSFLKNYRDKGVVHAQYKGAHLKGVLKPFLDLPPDVANEIEAAKLRLYKRTAAIYRYLRRAYPGLGYFHKSS